MLFGEFLGHIESILTIIHQKVDIQNTVPCKKSDSYRGEREFLSS